MRRGVAGGRLRPQPGKLPSPLPLPTHTLHNVKVPSSPAKHLRIEHKRTSSWQSNHFMTATATPPRVGLLVDDAREAYEVSVKHGAVGVAPPLVLEDAATGTSQTVSEVKLYGDVVIRWARACGPFPVAFLHTSDPALAAPAVASGWVQCLPSGGRYQAGGEGVQVPATSNGMLATPAAVGPGPLAPPGEGGGLGTRCKCGSWARGSRHPGMCMPCRLRTYLLPGADAGGGADARNASAGT